MTEPSWRKPFGILLIIMLIVVWAGIVASASSWISGLHWLLQLPIYLIAGIVWILPLKPLLLWMETGRWRA
ncbi:MAG: DUF2842 domain-containing protein [Parasphingopyxis sp.]